jgi:hypothetical protein
MTIYTVWTRTGLLRHAARDEAHYTLCGREHLGFVAPHSGARTPRFVPYITRQGPACRICIKEAGRDSRQDEAG